MAEYIAKINDSKKEAVADLKSRFDGISSFIFTDYRGLTVAQITEIRDKLRTSDTEFKVVKNRFAKIAMKDLGITDVDDFLKGPTAVAAIPGESCLNLQRAECHCRSKVQSSTENFLMQQRLRLSQSCQEELSLLLC